MAIKWGEGGGTRNLIQKKVARTRKNVYEVDFHSSKESQRNKLIII